LLSEPPGGLSARSHDDILAAIERLASLRESGVLSPAEFEAKKAELLSQL